MRLELIEASLKLRNFPPFRANRRFTRASETDSDDGKQSLMVPKAIPSTLERSEQVSNRGIFSTQVLCGSQLVPMVIWTTGRSFLWPQSHSL